MAYRIDPKVNAVQITRGQQSLDAARRKSCRHKLPPGHDAVLQPRNVRQPTWAT
jgi:hypothetical protein